MNLATRYLGLDLENPFVVGASPFCDDLDAARRLQDAGAAALIMRSLFEEQITQSRWPSSTTARPAATAAEFPDSAEYQFSPDEYLRQLERLKGTVSIPVIASLNAHHAGSWIDFSERIEAAGADAIELNFYQVVTDPSVASDEVETEMLQLVGAITAQVRIPVAVKLSPFHTSIAQLAVALELAGASGLVLFNRFYQPDINTEDLVVQPLLRLSDPDELLLRLRWLAIVSPLLRGSLSASGGIHSASDVVKSLLTGAHTVQLVSVLLKHGPRVITTLRDGLEAWMRERGYAGLEECRGLLNLQRCSDPAAFERANYIRVLQSWRIWESGRPGAGARRP
jgi:dihydroorotate dehydrogenase (fumarate)